jgi:Na+/H+-dicarboxylate symporter
MGRTLLESLALFIAPFVIYAIYLALQARYPLEVEHWTGRRVSAIALIGLAATVVGLLAMNVFAPRGRGLYIPAHIENGVLVPGRFE